MLMDKAIAITLAAIQAVGFACCGDPGRSLTFYHPDWQFFVKKFASSSTDEREWTTGALLDPSLSPSSPLSTASASKVKTSPSSPSRKSPRENSVPQEDDRTEILGKPFARRLVFTPFEEKERDNRGNKHTNKQSRHRHHRHRNRKERRRKKLPIRPTSPAAEVPIFDGGEAGFNTIFDIDTNHPHLSASLDVRDQLVLNRSTQVLRKNIHIASLEMVRRLLSDTQASF